MNTAGQTSFDEFVRRLAFIAVSANADAHIKNWSLIYPDRVSARISPAYDLVATIEFIEPDALALNLAKTKAWDQLTLEHFAPFARRVGADSAGVTSIVRTVVQGALDAWATIRSEYPVSRVLNERLEAHWKKVPP